MDEKHLQKTLEEINVPTPDDNVKKRALNLALAEFETVQKKNEKTFQGFSLLSRLIPGSNKNTGRETMKNRKLIYGGMATAMAVVLICGVSVQQFTTGSYKKQQSADETALATLNKAALAPEAKEELFRDRAAQKYTPPLEQHTDQGAVQSDESSAISPPPQPIMPMARTGAPAEMTMMMAESGAAGVSMSYQIPDYEIMPSPGYHEEGRDKFGDFEENIIKTVSTEPVSTFSIDVDTASYSFVRRQINEGVLPPKDAVRIEEMINYFDYDYEPPETKVRPFKPTVTIVPSPWKDGNKLLHIGIKGYDIAPDEKPRSNLVFLLDVSGSMNAQDKLPLLKNSMKLLLETLSPDDTVAIVVYAGAAGTVLEPTKASDKNKILQALDQLSAGGSTAGAEGIRQAYQLAGNNFDKEAVNRVILATDGDFNVGISNPEELKDFVERKRKSGVFLSVLGFGQGNYNDHLMQELAQNGNGVAVYIDSLSEARKVLVEEASATLFPIAKDVKIQIDFNPEMVAEYRLVGYETRHLNREDFNNDAVDAGDIGAGHTVTAIYEITPVGGKRAVEDSRYAVKTEDTKVHTDFSNEYAFLKIRYKLPDEETSNLITTPVTTENERDNLLTNTCSTTEDCVSSANDDVRFSVAVASFGQLLKGSKYSGKLDYDGVIDMAQQARSADEFGYRAEFINLVRLAKSAAALQKN
ncbi:MAG: VWA domain-containing protein [Alphaproteobacteria bacterium CG_4_9_14_3_um_filter_47_13]|nr:MAG: VWA domain-containing protein [Alphaproteobacteria bacterium CG_4_9_14_3_um_filter_47_13]